MLSLVLAAGLTVISASNVSAAKPSWSCAYLAERLPRVLSLLGDDTISAEDTRAARSRLSLAEAVLTRASGLALARSMGATRLVVVRCLDEGERTTIEAQTFDALLPQAGSLIRMEESLRALPSAIDTLARRLASGQESLGAALRAPSARALAKMGPALLRATASERARGLRGALDEDQGSLDLRLSTVEALIAARDFAAAIDVAGAATFRDSPGPVTRRLRFQSAASLLEVGRYAEARDALEVLRQEKETTAVLNNLGVARFRMRDPEASGLFERATFFTDHRQEDVAFNRAFALIFENKAGTALPALDAALLKDPTDVRRRLLRVWALSFLQREDDRAAEWDRLVTMAPSFSSLSVPDLGRRLERIFFFERSPSP